MSSDAATPAHESHLDGYPRLLFGLNALAAWSGIVLQLVITGSDMYRYTSTDPNLLGNNTSAVGRLIDMFSYFTILSNLTVAIVMTILALRPRTSGRVFKVLRLDALVMITITGLLYALLLAASANNQGLQSVASAIEHDIVPILTVVVWLLVGPRDWIRLWMIPASLILPLAWAAYTLVRGAVINAYPYPFLNVAKYGLSSVVITILEIAVVGIVFGLVFWGIDRLLGRGARASRAAAEEATAPTDVPAS